MDIAVATVVAFVLSLGFYAVVPTGAPDEKPAAWQIGVELLRSALVATLVTGLLRAAGWAGAGSGALLGLALWVLPVVLLTGSVIWERVPPRRAAPHAGDWLLKLLAIGAVVGAFA
jgi:hypothetical protein